MWCDDELEILRCVLWMMSMKRWGERGFVVVGEIFGWSFFEPGTHLLPSFSLAWVLHCMGRESRFMVWVRVSLWSLFSPWLYGSSFKLDSWRRGEGTDDNTVMEATVCSRLLYLKHLWHLCHSLVVLASLARTLGQSVGIILYYSLDGWVRD